jgi:UDP-N-acetylglucosamine 2-epimerase (non-hydrolysing)
MRAICVAGTRPDFIKTAPILDALRARGVATTLVHTGQHYDERMSGVFFDELALPEPAHHLGVGSGTHAEQLAGAMTAFEPLVEDLEPDVVTVVDAGNSALACALVAAKSGTPIAHVEAGTRCRDWTVPEEVNGVVIDRIASYHFASSAAEVANLRREGYGDTVHLVGSVSIDTLLANLDRARAHPIIGDLGMDRGGFGLVTLHRPSNVDDPEVLNDLMRGLAVVARHLPLLFPVHPRAHAQIAAMAPPGIRLGEPVGYLEFVALEAAAALVLTDSGGVQEETTALGVPCLTLRDTTDRPVTVTDGTNRVVGTDPDAIVAAAEDVLRDGVERRCPELWDGHAAARIADVLAGGA